MSLTNKKTYLILGLIIFLGVFLRIWMIGSVPPSVNWDEASLGYNAYSILQTGRDEYGKLFPIVLKSLGDFKPALYAYISIPFIKILGLTEISIRLPAVIFGSLTILTTFFLALELFKKRNIALVSSFLLAISPWSIQFSRFASEAMVGLFLNLLMILFFLKGLSRPWMLILSAVFGALALYSYQSEKIFLPLMVIALVSIYFKSLVKIQKKYLFSALFAGLLIALPIIYVSIANTDALTRARDTSFLNKPNKVITERHSQKLYFDEKNNDVIGKVFDNRRVVYGKEILNNYLSHFDLNYLFIKGDVNPRHKAPGMGHLYLFELPFLLLGLYFLIFGKFRKESKILVLIWMIITPIAASITWEVPHAIRTLNFLPTFQMIIAIGIVAFYEFIQSRKINKFIKYSIFGSIIILSTFNFIYFLNQYFVQYRVLNSSDWQYGFKAIAYEIKNNQNNFEKIIVSDEGQMSNSYIFFLFYLSYPPEKYLNEMNKSNINSSQAFDNFIFKKITEDDLQKINSNTLIIGRPQDFPDNLNVNTIKTINFLNGEEMGKIVTGR